MREKAGATKGETKETAGATKGKTKEKVRLDFTKFKPAQLKQYMGRLFKIGDKNGDGTLDKGELATLLGWSGFGFKASSVEEILSTCDKNGDGVIDKAEFTELMTNYCSGAADVPEE